MLDFKRVGHAERVPQAQALRDAGKAPLTLRIPEPAARPGEPADFSKLRLSEPGAIRRPAIDVTSDSIHDLAYGLIRVLDDSGEAVGPWVPDLSIAMLTTGLRAMLLTRAFDDRMYRAQRQGKASFYVKCTGEEAITAAQAAALEDTDMCFPSYRQQGLLIARGYPILKMMGQVYSNTLDPLLGRQMPVMYSSREHGFFSVSGNLGTQFIQAVGWAMASALSGDTRIAASWIGDGTTATAQGEMVAEIIGGRRRRFDPVAIPAVCFTEPEIVSVGLSPGDARIANTDASEVMTAQFPFSANGRALSMEVGDTGGFVRVVARKHDHRLLGIQAVGAHVSELSGEFAFFEASLAGLGHAIHS